MTFTFEDGELRQLLREHVQQTQPELISNDTDQTLTFPDWLGTGYKRDIELPSGISLTIHQYRLKEDIASWCKAGASNYVEFVFGLSCRTSYNSRQNYQSRQVFIAPACCEPGMWTEYAEQDCLAVDIHIDLSDLRGLVGEAEDSWPADFARLLVSDVPLIPTSPVRMTRSINLSLQQMLCCPYQGVTKTLYLEAKSLELLSLFIDATQESLLVPPALSRDDRERIYQAQQLLVDNLQTPPSLIGLARQVGLNDRKLKEWGSPDFVDRSTRVTS